MEKKLECPSCGRMAMVMKRGPSTMADGISVKHINRWVCNDCGEELFDSAALREIRAQRKGRREAA